MLKISKEKQDYVIDVIEENIRSRRKKTPIVGAIEALSRWQGENIPPLKFSSHFSYLLSLVQENLHMHVPRMRVTRISNGYRSPRAVVV